MRKRWEDDQIISYLEYKISEGTATQGEARFYEECVIEDRLIHSNYSRKLVSEMNRIWG